jgi:uncharacterized membrane protein (TIGR02234 family)
VTAPGQSPAAARPAGGRTAGGRREYLATLLLGAAGAALVLLSVRQGWARVVTIEPHPLPPTSVPVHGQDLVPAAGALGLAALAGLAAVVATRRTARRVVGGVLAAFGAVIILAVSMPLTSAQIRAVARLAPASSVTGGGTVGSGSTGSGAGVAGVSLSSHVALAAVPWRWAVLLGAVAVLAAGLLAAWRGAGWPVMSSRYERPPGRERSAGQQRSAGREPAAGPADPAALWESLSQGIDPTEPGAPASQGRPDTSARRDGGLNRGLS